MALGVSVLLWTVHKIMFHNICTLPQVIFPSLTLYVCMCVCVKNGMAVYSSILAWRISWSEEPWNCRVGHDWETCTLCHYFKVYGPYHQWDVLFYGLIIGWFWVPNSVATPCSIYLQRKSKCSFFFFFLISVGCRAHPWERAITMILGNSWVPVWLNDHLPVPE